METVDILLIINILTIVISLFAIVYWLVEYTGTNDISITSCVKLIWCYALLKLGVGVKGYKAVLMDMTTRPFAISPYQYATNEWHHIDGEIQLCKNGFHFCTNLIEVFNYYNEPGLRIFRVIGKGKFNMDSSKIAVSDIYIGEELEGSKLCSEIKKDKRYGSRHIPVWLKSQLKIGQLYEQ